MDKPAAPAARLSKCWSASPEVESRRPNYQDLPPNPQRSQKPPYALRFAATAESAALPVEINHS
jgi:hypothetical protein